MSDLFIGGLWEFSSSAITNWLHYAIEGLLNRFMIY